MQQGKRGLRALLYDKNTVIGKWPIVGVYPATVVSHYGFGYAQGDGMCYLRQMFTYLWYVSVLPFRVLSYC